MAGLIGSLLGGLGSLGASMIGDLGKKAIQTIGNVGQQKLKQLQSGQSSQSSGVKKLSRRIDQLEGRVQAIETQKKRKMQFERPQQTYVQDDEEEG